MNLERGSEIKALLCEVLERPPADRERFLAEHPSADAELKREVGVLLRDHPAEAAFLVPPLHGASEPPLRRLSLSFVGCSIGDFELQGEIGRGASGVVYRAKQISLDRPAAVKLLAHHLCASEPARARFRREAEAASKLRHEAIVSIYSFGEQNGACYIAMELVTGTNLRDLVADRVAHRAGIADTQPKLEFDVSDPLVAAELVEQLARGLHHSHEHGVLHRDVKPENIVLDEKRRPRLIDFGLAKDSALSALTQTGMISGTPHYMSPEQARAIGSTIDRRTDIYSLGVVLYELLSLQRPFEFVSPSELLHAIGHEEPKDVALVRRSVPEGLAAVCMKAIAKLPEHRYATAAAMADDLRLFMAGKRTRAPRRSSMRTLRTWAVHHRVPVAAALLLACVAFLPSALTLHKSVEAGQPTLAGTQSPSRLMRAGFEASIRGLEEPERLKRRKTFNEFLKRRIRDNEVRDR